MIRLRDTLQLSYTKLRTRRIRLVVTIIVAGLLFTSLAAGSFVAQGVIGSLRSFSKEGLGTRFIVLGLPVEADVFLLSDKELIKRAREIHTDLITSKKAEARRLRIEYDEKSEEPPVSTATFQGEEEMLNMTTLAAQKAVAEYFANHPVPDKAALWEQAKTYGATAAYGSTSITSRSSYLRVLKQGSEDTSKNALEMTGGDMPRGLDSFSASWGLFSEELLQPFVIRGQDLTIDKDGRMPVIVPYSAAEELLKLTALSASATPEAKLARLKEVRERITDIQFDVCYRNDSSVQLLQSAIDAAEERTRKGKDYVQPELIRGKPVTACGEIPVVRDVRSYAQKQADAGQEEFNRLFGAESPHSEILRFRVVGIVPDMFNQSASTVTSLAQGVITSTLGEGWFTPLSAREGNGLVAQLQKEVDVSQGYPLVGNAFVEFADASATKRFMNEKSCEPYFGDFPMTPDETKNPMKDCIENKQYFMLSSFGSNSLALDEASRQFGKYFRYAVLVMAGISSIILMGTVGRIVADSRRETAVFRAIGAKRLDIAQIYILYVVQIGLLIAAFACGAGFLLAKILEYKVVDEITVHALVAFNASDLSKQFGVVGFHAWDIFFLILLIVGAALFSATVPLLANVRRSPIRDMRDER